LTSFVGKRVVVRLTSGIDYRGTRALCLDEYMIIALEQTEELVGGTLTNRYGDTYIRGHSGSCSLMLMSAQPPTVLYIGYSPPNHLECVPSPAIHDSTPPDIIHHSPRPRRRPTKLRRRPVRTTHRPL
ncbi:hypothetical protein DAEQUDRAFT_680565, partial [Daedalea quercina L-15889]